MNRWTARLCLRHTLSLALFAALLPGTAAANLVSNAGLETYQNGSFQYWNPIGTSTISSSATATQGVRSASIGSRTSLSAGLKQVITTPLKNAGSGQNWNTDFAVQVSAPASVRCKVQLIDASGTRYELLSEQVVRTANTWVRVANTRRISWTGTLTSAVLYFEVGQVAEVNFPQSYPAPYVSYLLDDVRMELDSDRDLLAAPQESAAGTSDSNPDTDGDGLPDGWEVAQSLNPLSANGSADPDGDGYSNLEEYAGATHPGQAGSKPAVPSNSNALTEVGTVLDFLATLPTQSSNKFIVGQHATTLPNDYDDYVVGLGNATGYYPGIYEVSFQMGSGGSNNYESVLNEVLNHWEESELVSVQWNPYNPWTGEFYGSFGSEINITELLTPGTAANTTWMAWLSDLADYLEKFEQAGKIVLFRPMCEMNGQWYWWGGRPQSDYIALWQQVHTYMSDTRGIDNIIWVYASVASSHLSIPFDYYYPGDAYVDVFGANNYDYDWVLPFELNQLGMRYPKVMAFPEAGNSITSASNNGGNWDNLTYRNTLQSDYPRISYFTVYNSYTTWNNGSVDVNLAIVDNLNATALMTDPLIRTLEEMPF